MEAANSTEHREEKVSKKNRKKEYLKDWIPYRIKRYLAYVVATIVALAMPWITIGATWTN